MSLIFLKALLGILFETPVDDFITFKTHDDDVDDDDDDDNDNDEDDMMLMMHNFTPWWMLTPAAIKFTPHAGRTPTFYYWYFLSLYSMY